MWINHKKIYLGLKTEPSGNGGFGTLMLLLRNERFNVFK